jgi:hypothetical protein
MQDMAVTGPGEDLCRDGAVARSTWQGLNGHCKEEHIEALCTVHVKRAAEGRLKEAFLTTTKTEPQPPDLHAIENHANPPGTLTQTPCAIAREKDKTEKHHLFRHHHFSLDMNIDAIHVRNICILDQTFWRFQSLAVKLEMNNPLGIEFETPSCCIDHLDKGCALRM